MQGEDSSVAVSVGNVHVDKAVVTSTRPDVTQTWLQMTPLFSLLITALALVLTTGIQIGQTYLAAKQKKDDQAQKTDEDWRASVDKLSDDPKNALSATLEMETYLNAPAYRERAAVIMASKLPLISDKEQFDVEFAEVVMRTDAGYLFAPLTVAKVITSNLKDQYSKILSSMPEHKLVDTSFAAFVLDPETFGAEGKDLQDVLTETWKLDSTIRGLQHIWSRPGRNPRVSPENGDLSGIEFYCANPPVDFTGISFEGADLSNSEFIGNCIVTDPNAKKVVRKP